MNKINKTVIILAGGNGNRMNAQIPKQFLPLAGKPVLMHTILAFYHFERSINIVLVIPFAHVETWNRLCSRHRFIIPHSVVNGGDERFFSVQNGLNSVAGEGIIALHDGVRPLVSKQVIENCFATAQLKGSAIPAVRPSESVRILKENESEICDRNNVLLIQTPQTFDAERIKIAYQTEYMPQFTDDATVYEADGNKIEIVDGNPENIKITNPSDLFFAETIIKQTVFSMKE
jgi:2-C-methyl-D-erythritol 4-phosphate cytidylyltransferase